MNHCAEILKEKPHSIVFARCADNLFRRGDLSGARALLEKGLGIHPTYAPAHALLAQIHYTQGLYEKAIEELQTALILDPQSPRDALTLGTWLMEQNHPDTALMYFHITLQYEPSAPDVIEGYRNAQECLKVLASKDVQEEPTVTEELLPQVEKNIIEENLYVAGNEKSETGAEISDEQEIVNEADISMSDHELVETSLDDTTNKEEILKNEEEGSEEKIHNKFEEDILSDLYGDMQQNNLTEKSLPIEESSVNDTEIGEIVGYSLGENGEELSGYSEIFGGDRIGITSEGEIIPNSDTIFELEETDKYDLTSFTEDVPVLSEEERAELLALQNSTEQDSEPGVSTEETLKEETSEEAVENESPEDMGDFAKGIFTELTQEELDILSISDRDKPESYFSYGNEIEAIVDKGDRISDIDFIKQINDSEYDLPELEPPQELIGGSDEYLYSAVSNERPSEWSEDLVPPITKVDGKSSIIHDVDHATLDDLLKEYIDSLEDITETGRESHDVPLIMEFKKYEKRAPDSGSQTDNITPTLAEIYASQGLLSQAIGMYQSLLENEPGNETIQARLQELKEKFEHQSDNS